MTNKCNQILGPTETGPGTRECLWPSSFVNYQFTTSLAFIARTVFELFVLLGLKFYLQLFFHCLLSFDSTRLDCFCVQPGGGLSYIQSGHLNQ